MLDSLHELFQERGDKITATLIAERMEQKIKRHVAIWFRGQYRQMYRYSVLAEFQKAVKCGSAQ